MRYWEIIAERLQKSGWSYGYCAVFSENGLLFVVDAHRGDGRRFVVHSDEKLTAFLELEAIIQTESKSSSANKQVGKRGFDHNQPSK